MGNRNLSASQTHQTITATLELPVPIGDYCLATGASAAADCAFLSVRTISACRCLVFQEDVEITEDFEIIKCTKCKEAKVKI